MKVFLTISLTLLGTLCLAQQDRLLLGMGTNGLNIGFEKELHKQFSLGTSLSFLQVYGNVTNVVFDNQISTNYQTNSALLEGFVKWHPRFKPDEKNPKKQSRFFAKAGLALRFNPSYSALSTLLDKTMIGAFELNKDQVGYVNVDIKTNKIQPMLGFGYTIIDKKRFFVTTEAGAYFHGRPKVEMQATGTLHLNTINQDAIQRKITNYRYYPLLKIETGIKL